MRYPAVFLVLDEEHELGAARLVVDGDDPGGAAGRGGLPLDQFGVEGVALAVDGELAAEDEDVAVLVEVAEVAGAGPAARHGCQFAVLAQVALQGVGGVHLDLAHLPGRQGQSVLVGDAQPDALHRPAAGDGVVEGREGDVAQFGAAVAVQQRQAELLDVTVDERLVQGRGAGAEHPHLLEVGAQGRGAFQDVEHAAVAGGRGVQDGAAGLPGHDQ